MVKFVDHYVVEVLRRELFEVFGPGECLDRCAKDIYISISAAPLVVADPCTMADTNKGLRRLREDLFAVRYEEHATGASLSDIEGSKPGLPETRREYDHSTPKTLLPSLLQSAKCSILNGCRLRGHFIFVAAWRN